MFGFPLWLCASFAAPFVATVFLTMMMKMHRQRIDEFKAQGMRPGEAIRAARGSWRFVVLGFLLMLLSVGILLGAGGKYDDIQVNAACAKHGMDGFRSFGHNGCLTKDGQVRYFKDVQ